MTIDPINRLLYSERSELDNLRRSLPQRFFEAIFAQEGGSLFRSN